MLRNLSIKSSLARLLRSMAEIRNLAQQFHPPEPPPMALNLPLHCLRPGDGKR